MAEGLRAKGAEFLHEPDANMIFAHFPRAVHQKLRAAGAVYGVSPDLVDGDDPHEMIPARMVCDWAITHDQIDAFLSHF